MKKRAFLIHGWEGSSSGGWFPWLKQELEKEDFEVFIPDFPNTNHPQMEKWVDHLDKIVGQADENSYFIGHSLGVITILRYLERLKMGKAKKAILVAGFTSNLGYQELSNFFPHQGQLQ